MLLKDIKDPSDLKQLKYKELKTLASEIRAFLAESIPKTGGHLSSNLGVVELTIALHYVFDSPKDGIIFDVGHQAYTHKLLTGRMPLFDTLRQTDGLSGYINYNESIHDVWESGHAGSSLSALVGLIYANHLKQVKADAIAIIGDASITNGMAFEALNLLGSEKDKKGIIILNDNKMSISKSVGAISKALAKIRSMALVRKINKLWHRMLPRFLLNILSRVKRGVRGFFQTMNIFEDLGYMYIGPIDGHDLKSLIKTLHRIKTLNRSVVLHVVTKKGLGHKDAQSDEIGHYHGVSKAEAEKKAGISWSLMISKIIEDIQKVQKTFVVMPAMTVGTQFIEFKEKFPDQFVDVGIAEEHAATMAASLAHQGIKVFLSLYSSFSQRAFDQILNDIARSDHHVVIGIDRAGIIGDDGSTHQGLFDVSMFNLMPNVVIAMPYDAQEACDLLYYGFKKQKHPFIIRYPRGKVFFDTQTQDITYQDMSLTWTVLEEGKAVILIGYGPQLNILRNVKRKMGIDAMIVNARFIKPIDEVMLKSCLDTGLKVLVYEEASNIGGLYPQVLRFMAKHHYHNPIIECSITDQVVEHGSYEDVLKRVHMDEDSIIKQLKELLNI